MIRFLFVFFSNSVIESPSKSLNLNANISEILKPELIPKTTKKPNL